jgi:hypothetical protein
MESRNLRESLPRWVKARVRAETAPARGRWRVCSSVQLFRKQDGARISVAHVIAYQLHLILSLSASADLFRPRLCDIELWLSQDNPLPSSTTSIPIIHHGSSTFHVYRVTDEIANTYAAFNRPAQRAGTPPRPSSASIHPNPNPRPKAPATCAATSGVKCVAKATPESPNSKSTKTATITNTASA